MKKRSFLTSHFGIFILLGTSLLTLSACLKKGEIEWNPTLSFNSSNGVSLNYSSPASIYTNGSAITPNSPSVIGGTILSYSVNPALPSGLSLNSTSGIISGTPTGVFANTAYMISGIHSAGVSTAWVNITVNDIPPSSLGYTTPSPVYTNGVSISTNVASTTGGAVVSFSVSPPLPTGLSLNTSDGRISGTPSGIYPSSTYAITATNTGGSISTNLNITVNDVAPSALTYTSYPVVYTVGSSISANSPSSSGGSVVSYSVSPSLPSGLSFNTSTGIITGTPTAITASQNYTITATNSGGSTNFNLNITVNDGAPSGLSYSTAPAVYTRNSAITNNTPSYSGGTATSFSITPALPSGLSLNTSTGVISGTPTVVSGSASYTITATNAGGSTNFNLNITVNDVAPSGLSYSAAPAVYTKNVAITTNTPSYSGGTATSFAVSPALPTGLSFNTSNGFITGTPTSITASASYTVTATNSGGSANFNLNITVNDAAPAGLGYSEAPAIYTKNSAITNNTPSSGGGAVISYSVSPALPSGLNLNAASGVISGTPTAVSAATSYTITATNSGGNTTFNLSITVNDIAPSGLTYSEAPAVYTKNTAITTNTPTYGGGMATSFSVAPALPPGLSLNTTTGFITGTPTTLSTVSTYTITATNSGGSTNYGLNITVNDVAPSSLAYSDDPAVYTAGIAITNNTPSSSGGAVVSYSVSPPLPGGLSLNTSTGVISGTPSAMTASNSYTITATNSGGNTTKSINITVNDVPPNTLSYLNAPAVYIKGSTITNNTPSSGGGAVVSYSVSPSLPSGLSFNTSTGVISGTPTAVSPSASYTITATNSGGNTTFNLNITVNDIPPAGLAYSANPAVYTIGVAITDNTPTSTGGAVVSYSVAPALPTGLSLNSSTGVISGTPSAIYANATYTITATNSGGNTTANVDIRVNDGPPTSISYSTNPAVYVKNTFITVNTPSVTGGTPTGYSVAPGLPNGLTINPTTGVISGAPTTVQGANTYTITVSNANGSTNVGVSITVNDLPPYGLNYSQNPVTYIVGSPITNNIPTVTYGAISSYSVSPSLPSGLSLNGSTGEISGTPSSAAPHTTYTVTANGPNGSTGVGLTIVVENSVTSSWTGGIQDLKNFETGGVGTRGTIDGAFGDPRAIAIDTQRNLVYVVEAANWRVSRYDLPTGTAKGWIGSIGVQPTGGDPGCTSATPGTFTPGWCSGGQAQISSGTGNGSLGVVTGIALDVTNNILYVVDNQNHRINRYNAGTGAYTGWIGTVGGVPTGGDPGCTSTSPGSATPGWCTGGSSGVGTGDGKFNTPMSVAFDSVTNMLYVADASNNRIQRVNAATGIAQGWIGRVSSPPTGGEPGCASLAAPNPTPGWCLGGVATSGSADSMFNLPHGVAVDNANNRLYVADTNNHRIQRFNLSTGAFLGWNGKVGVTPTDGDSGCSSTINPNNTPGWCFGGTAGSGSETGNLWQPRSISVDPSNSVYYVSEGSNHRIQKFNYNGNVIGWTGRVFSTPTGGASGCTSTAPGMSTPGWCTGGSPQSGTADGALNSPYALVYEPVTAKIYVAEASGHRISVFNGYLGNFLSWLGSNVQPLNSWSMNGLPLASSAAMNGGKGLAIDSSSGNIYVADEVNHRVVRISKATGAITGWIGGVSITPTGGAAACSSTPSNAPTPGWCIGGQGGLSGTSDGFFTNPSDVTLDSASDYLYVLDRGRTRIVRYQLSTGVHAGWIGKISTTIPTGGDPGCSSASINTYTPGWCIGGVSVGGNTTGAMNSPEGIVFVPGSPAYLLVSDSANNRIGKYNAANGAYIGWIGNVNVTPTGGAAGCTSASANQFTPGWCLGGSATSNGQGFGQLNFPTRIALEPSLSVFYVADTGNQKINKYDVATGAFLGWIGNVSGTPTGGDAGCTSAVFGTFSPGWCIGGTATIANSGQVGFQNPRAVTATSNHLYITDSTNSRIIKYDHVARSYVGWKGMLRLTAGSAGAIGGGAGCAGLLPLASTPTWCTGGTAGAGYHTGMFNAPAGIATDGTDIYVGDTGNSRIMRLNGL
jgi:uncharacterized repeat protein (TIGR01451 family)